MRTALLWLRNDLRLHDHAPLAEAARAERLVAVYCVDPRHYEENDYGFPKADSFRARFLLESLRDLRARMRARGGDLVVRVGKPEAAVPELVREAGADAVFFHDEPMREERDVEDALRAALPAGVDVRAHWGHTLLHPEDLDFPLDETPENFSAFRKRVEKGGLRVRDEAPEPERLPPLPGGVEPGRIPDGPADLGLEDRPPDPHAPFRLAGGETQGLARVHTYAWEGDRLRVYKETRNGMLEPDDSTKLSAWLSNGCLSPRRAYYEVLRYERERVQNESTYWLVFELLWRDYFRFYGAKHGDRLFYSTGPLRRRVTTRFEAGTFARWTEGRTGYPLVDAVMRELAATGFCSNRGRQNVASLYAKGLGLDWRAGAAYFESLLVDYDVTSNWGNWCYVAGVGADPRDREFNVERQAEQYDPDARFIKRWMPELAALPPHLARAPYRGTADELARYDFELGTDYPRPLELGGSTTKPGRARQDEPWKQARRASHRR